MKLANALSQRSELQTRIRQLESRLSNNALVQEGSSPPRTPWSCWLSWRRTTPGWRS